MRLDADLEDTGEDSTLQALSGVWDTLRDITPMIGTDRKGERRDALIRVSEEYLHTGAPIPCALNRLHPRWLTRHGRHAAGQRVWAFPEDGGLWAALLRWWGIHPALSPISGQPVWANAEHELFDRLYGRSANGVRHPYDSGSPVNAVTWAWLAGGRRILMALDDRGDPMSALLGVRADTDALRAFARSMLDGSYHRQQYLEGGLGWQAKPRTARRTPKPRETRARTARKTTRERKQPK